MSALEVLRKRFARPAGIDFSQSVELFTSINSAARLIRQAQSKSNENKVGHDMKSPEIRAAHDKIALAATDVAQAVPILNAMTKLDREIEVQTFLINFFKRQGNADDAEWFEKKYGENRTKLEILHQGLEDVRRAAGLTLNNYDFSRANLFSGGWGLVVFGLGRGAERWNKHALLVPCDEKGKEIVQKDVDIQEKTPAATAIEISLAQLSSPYFDAPTIVQATMVPLVTIDAQGVKLNPFQAPHMYKIYNTQHVAMPIRQPLFSPRLVYPK